MSLWIPLAATQYYALCLLVESFSEEVNAALSMTFCNVFVWMFQLSLVVWSIIVFIKFHLIYRDQISAHNPFEQSYTSTAYFLLTEYCNNWGAFIYFSYVYLYLFLLFVFSFLLLGVCIVNILSFSLIEVSTFFYKKMTPRSRFSILPILHCEDHFVFIFLTFLYSMLYKKQLYLLIKYKIC